MLAMRYGLRPLGTMAHEYLQACQALGPRLRDSQIFAFETWAREYRGDLGIALSDVYGLDAFLRDFDMYFCKLFDGARHDSGDPFEWDERLIRHYTANRVDPASKTLVFSDSLTFDLMKALYRRFHERVVVRFGIGTNLTNDLGYKPLAIVIKMVGCNGQPVAKLSDDPGKNMVTDHDYLQYLRKVFDISSQQIPTPAPAPAAWPTSRAGSECARAGAALRRRAVRSGVCRPLAARARGRAPDYGAPDLEEEPHAQQSAGFRAWHCPIRPHSGSRQRWPSRATAAR